MRPLRRPFWWLLSTLCALRHTLELIHWHNLSPKLSLPLHPQLPMHTYAPARTNQTFQLTHSHLHNEAFVILAGQNYWESARQWHTAQTVTATHQHTHGKSIHTHWMRLNFPSCIGNVTEKHFKPVCQLSLTLIIVVTLLSSYTHKHIHTTIPTHKYRAKNSPPCSILQPLCC